MLPSVKFKKEVLSTFSKYCIKNTFFIYNPKDAIQNILLFFIKIKVNTKCLYMTKEKKCNTVIFFMVTVKKDI